MAVVGGGSALAVTRPWHKSRNGVTTQVATAQRTTIVQTVSASGTIAPAKQADLDFAVTGRVTNVRVTVGDVVRKGDVLAKVGTDALLQQRAAALATVTADEAKVAADAAGSAQLAADQAALTAARSSLSNATAAVKDATLRAAISGTVTAVNLSVGQAVTGGGTGAAGQGNGSSSQVAIQSTSTFVVNATVDDTQIKQVKEGQDVSITPQGASTPVAGTVTSVGRVPTSSSGVVSFPVTVAVDGHPTDVYAGSSATLSITTDKAVDVLAIPTLAITYSGSSASVEVKTGSGTQTRPITVGQTYGLQTEVKSGLQPGDKVVVRMPTFARISNGGNGGGAFTRGFGNGGGGNFGFPGRGGNFGFSGGGGFGGGPPTVTGGGG